ncbi:helix-turn-helix domain-containing protein [Sphingobacterium sp. SRCM116780]|uniref:helix-turn-helix domain-containing protein n=1 Tax=Sphingobacterium sp. SRCM116780 TaxID=2907623 RepID=UPI001F32BB55|nr:helix-turn-helix domain-containing protein [Sphingobacterium sp. SRCM116780]UIR54834.1 helix-turn-helix domain-containing protein [Sphingobacterium sp. SRCM116780]
MEQAYKFDTVSQYNAFNNHETLHPLVSVVDFSKANERTGSRMTFGLYCIFLKAVNCGDLKYGCNYYDYQEGTLVFISPGQVIDVENKVDVYQPMGHGLVFHPDLIKGTSLAKSINEYSFFNYKTNEALHLSERERKIVFDCFSKIEYELSQSVDKHSKKLIASNIELFLNYCERFYDRQFITRENANKGILEHFEEFLNGYFLSDNPTELGVPSVAYFADKMNLSANYFGDLIKKETGKSAQEYIQNKIIDEAKNKIFDGDKTINEIAYELGFKYPQHFSRFFKKIVGQSPNEFRTINMN